MGDGSRMAQRSITESLIAMDITRYKEVENIFVEVVDLPIDVRLGKVRELTDDDQLIQLVESLLDEHERLVNDNFMDTGVLGQPIDSLSTNLTDHSPNGIQGYRVSRVLGKGASSTVYLAQSPPPLDRPVALKLIHIGAGNQTLARFQEEQRILADLHHTGIAEVYDTGLSEDGRPFTVLEFIEGQSITEYCRSNTLDWKSIAGLLIQCCNAVAHAHQRNIVHRDIKPSNLLIADASGSPMIKVIDFGTAKLVDPLRTMTQLTVDAQFVGTLPYSAPEQLSMTSSPDTRTDIHALGVVLFECLDRRHPFFENGDGIKTILDGIITIPIPKLTSNSNQPTIELDAIIGKACEKDPSDRYPSIAHLADDLHNLIEGLPVAAMHGRKPYLARKFVRRHRVTIALGTLVFTALVSLSGVAVNQALKANRNRDALRATAIRMVDDLMPMLADLSGTAEAREELSLSLESRIDELLQSTPNDHELLLRKALILEYKSDIVLMNGQVEEAEALRTTAIGIIESIQLKILGNSDLLDRTQRRLLIKLGDIAKERKDYATAESLYNQHHELLLALPGDHREGVCWSYERLGWVSGMQGHHDSAINIALQRLRLSEELLAENSNSPSYLNNAARAHQILAEKYLSSSKFDLSLEHARRSMKLATSLTTLEPNNYSSQEIGVIANTILTRSLYYVGQIDEGSIESDKLLARSLQLVELNPGRESVKQISWSKLNILNNLWLKFEPDRSREELHHQMHRLMPNQLPD